MNEKSGESNDDNLEPLLISFFSNVTWPLIRNLIQELVTLENAKKWKTNLKGSFVNLTTLKMDNESKIPDIECVIDEELYDPETMPSWITPYIGNILKQFSSDVARALNKGDTSQVKWIIKTASVMNLFEGIFWRFIHQTLQLNTGLKVNTINSIKDKLKEQLKRYMDEEISLMEVKNAVLSYLVEFDMKNEFILELVVGFMRTFYDLINSIDIEEIENFITKYGETLRENEIHEYALSDDESSNINTVVKWFVEDFLNLCIKSLKALYPELTNEKIKEWKGRVQKDLHLLLEDMLSLEDFSKRFLKIIQNPKLEFDIEKGIDENESAMEMMNIENRGSIIQSMLSCAEMIYDEHGKDPLMRELLENIKRKKDSSDMLYF